MKTPPELQAIVIEEENEIHRERPENFLPVSAVTWSYRSDTHVNGFCGQGGLL